MKLNAAQVERALGQFDARALPENHPVVPQLNTLFGDHTFFLDRNGLNVVEPTEIPEVETKGCPSRKPCLLGRCRSDQARSP
jgi:hypothetical protein